MGSFMGEQAPPRILLPFGTVKQPFRSTSQRKKLVSLDQLLLILQQAVNEALCTAPPPTHAGVFINPRLLASEIFANTGKALIENAANQASITSPLASALHV
jgi:hypothetical protein